MGHRRLLAGASGRKQYHGHTCMAPLIRSFQSRDLPGMHALDQVCFSSAVAYSRAELRYFLTQPNCSCWIVESEGNKLAGFIIVERVSRNGLSSGHIVTLDVDPLSRRHGLGRLLMQTAESRMMREGASMMSLEVAEDNATARHFYRSLGFVARGKIANYYGGRIDAEVMQKMIGSA
jgi:[ribosomal protein S18]-alanine N-acetyltransferase